MYLYDLNVTFSGQDPTSTAVLLKLLFYSLLIIILPISFYFSSKAYLFEGKIKLDLSNSITCI